MDKTFIEKYEVGHSLCDKIIDFFSSFTPEIESLRNDFTSSSETLPAV